MSANKFNSVDMRFVRFMARRGLTDRQIAEELDVSESTIGNWKRKYPEFFEDLQEWKEEADQKVEMSLYQRAIGYDYSSEKAFYDKNTGMVVKATVNCHTPPDVTACIFWLKNRKPKEWRDKQELELANKDAPISVTLNYKKKEE